MIGGMDDRLHIILPKDGLVFANEFVFTSVSVPFLYRIINNTFSIRLTQNIPK